MMSEEVWRHYPEFNFIEGSSLGRVRTLDRFAKYGNHTQFVKGRILKQRRKKDGYMDVGFSVNGKPVNRLVHRIIASCFLINHDNLPQVNHKDCDPTNNNISNLEWCDNSYNQKYREKYGVSQTEVLGCPVFAINLKTLEVLRFRSQREASRKLKANSGHLNEVIKGKRNKANGYWFTNADKNAVEAVKVKFGDTMAHKVEKLMNKK